MGNKKMVAQVNMRYRTRMLRAGDQFETNTRDARVLEAIGRAKPYVERVVKVIEPAKPVIPPHDPIDDLRSKAESLGIEVDKRWREHRLNEEIEKASKPVQSSPTLRPFSARMPQVMAES